MRDHNYFVYILANPGQTALYTGVTNDLEVRIIQHYNNRGNKSTFAGRYHCYNLLYFERFELIEQAIEFEKIIKGWTRKRKLDLIRERNPGMKVLNAEIMEWPPEKGLTEDSR